MLKVEVRFERSALYLADESSPETASKWVFVQGFSIPDVLADFKAGYNQAIVVSPDGSNLRTAFATMRSSREKFEAAERDLNNFVGGFTLATKMVEALPELKELITPVTSQSTALIDPSAISRVRDVVSGSAEVKNV